jgi:chemotaxis protein MotB
VIRKQKKAAAGAPLWMVTFADMMTLLVTFFVLLFSFVIIDQQRYATQAEYIKAGFTASVFDQLRGRVGDLAIAQQQGSIVPQFPTLPSAPDLREANELQPTGSTDNPDPVEPSEAEQVEDAITERLGGMIDMGDVTVERLDDEVIIRLQDRFAFQLGSEIVQPQFREMLMEIKGLLRGIDGEFVVSGHTDDLPIRTARFRSNWELSAARAASVVHELTQDGTVPAERFRVEGYAETQPIAENTTPDGRASNRRVEILIRPRTVVEPASEESIIEFDDWSGAPNGPG